MRHLILCECFSKFIFSGSSSSRDYRYFIMKKFVPYLLVLIAGAVVGGWLCGRHFRKEVGVERVDTLYVYDTVRYVAEDLKTVEVPVIKTEYIRVPEVMVKREVVHDTVFVVLKRQQYYTERDGLHIWHSGVQSRIDSVDYVERSWVIQKAHLDKPKKNYLSVGAEAAYVGTFSLPIYIEYERMLHKNFSIYARGEYDVLTKTPGGRMGARAFIGW